jgi:hypothetical protein
MRHGQFHRQIRIQSNAVIFSSDCFIQRTKKKDKKVCRPTSFGCIRYIRKGPFLSYPYRRWLHAGLLNAQTLPDSVTTHTHLGKGWTSNQRYGSNKIMTYMNLIQYNGKNKKKTVVNWNLQAEKRFLISLLTYLPRKMEQTECSETSAHKIQTPGNYPEENIQHEKRLFQSSQKICDDVISVTFDSKIIGIW